MATGKAPKRDKRWEAQELAYKAMEAGGSKESVLLATQALELDPRCVDALLLMLDTLNSTEERIAHLSHTIQIAEEDLGGKPYLEENRGYFWGLLETRPYMRAKSSLAQSLRFSGKPNEAIAEYEEMLELNPSDNQGVRYDLVGLYLDVGNLDGVRRLKIQYDEPTSAVFAWAGVFEQVMVGDTIGATKALANARKVNPYVERYLTGETPLPDDLPDYYSSGDENEAVSCTLTLGRALAEHPEVFNWLFGQTPSAVPVPKDMTGRNEPCPCGSGKKYKKGCINKPVQPPPTGKSFAGEIALHEMQAAMEGKDIKTDEEMEAFFQEYNQSLNKKAIDDFCGLSAEQMHHLLYSAFESPEVVEFKAVLDSQPTAPIATLFTGMVSLIGQGGVKCTAKGNLPLKVVSPVLDAYVGEFGSHKFPPLNCIRSEIDFDRLHVTRLMAETTGLVRKYQGKFVLTKKCNRLLAGDGLKAIYPMLLEACSKRLVWASGDHFPEIRLIQSSFAFSLFLLGQFGCKARENSYYESAFLKAFPMVLEEIEAHKYETQEDIARGAYTLRFLDRFAEFLGLVEFDFKESGYFSHNIKLKKTPLLASAVNFKVP